MFSKQQKASRGQTKLHNQRLVLKKIYDHGEISRADIARATHLARTTVSNVVSTLIAEGLVEEVGQRMLDRGKPATLLHIVADSRYLIGVDLASSAFRGAVLDLRGDVIHWLSTPLDNRGYEPTLQLVYELIDELTAVAPGPILGIGVGVPGLVDAEQGIIRYTTHFEWRDVPLRQLLVDRYQLPIHVANDSHMAALGEYTFGNGQDVSNLVVLTVDFGVSAGVVLNGRLHFGDSFGAGEIGHITVKENGESCLCGNRGCLETVVNEPLLIEQAREIAHQNPHSKLHQFIQGLDKPITIENVLDAFEAGDIELLQAVSRMGQYLGYAIAGIVSILNIERILISGGMARFGSPLLTAIQDEMREKFHPILAAKTQIDFSDLGQDIVIQGASALVLSREMGLV